MDIFCKIVNKELPSNIFYEDNLIMGIMDAYPNKPGHALIIPKKHYTDILETDKEILNKMFDLAKKTLTKMEENYPNFNGGHFTINYGELQVVKHLHLHIIPNYTMAPKMSQEEACEILKK